jgi:AcrR family transcriptional regulator
MTISKSRRPARSGLGRLPREQAKPLPKPRKRPIQDRAKFTIEAIYGAFVRIWTRDGAQAVTMRAVAEEAGFAIGTLYEYFPNKTALHSGYVRHAIDRLLARIDRQTIAAEGGDWRARLATLVAVTCGADDSAPFFDAEMLRLEGTIAEARHHRRAFEELSARWTQALRGWSDLPAQPPQATIDALVLAVWGARRYRLILDAPDGRLAGWVGEITAICENALAAQESL